MVITIAMEIYNNHSFQFEILLFRDNEGYRCSIYEVDDKQFNHC